MKISRTAFVLLVSASLGAFVSSVRADESRVFYSAENIEKVLTQFPVVAQRVAAAGLVRGSLMKVVRISISTKLITDDGGEVCLVSGEVQVKESLSGEALAGATSTMPSVLGFSSEIVKPALGCPSLPALPIPRPAGVGRHK